MRISYSIAIRTLGTAGEKYIKLMQSIMNQIIQPVDVFVVLPEGFKPPERVIGTEKFVYCKKGMITQRFAALKYINTKYVLFCDDDVEFESDFVNKLIEPLESGKYECSAGPLLNLFPPKKPKYLIASLLGGACVMLRDRKKQYVRFLRTGGWSYNHNIDTKSHKYYNTDSLAWACFMIKTEVINNIHLEHELWLEQFGYGAFDDQAMCYKLKRNNYNICIVSDALYIHNDGKTSVRDLKLEPIYAYSFNHYVCWHRYIYSFADNDIERMWCLICLRYYEFMNFIYEYIKIIGKRSKIECLNTIKKAQKDARKFVKSIKYRNLPNVISDEKCVDKRSE